MVERLFTVEEAAREVLRIGRTHLYEKLAASEIRSIVIGRLRRIPESALEAYIERLKAEQGAETGA